jgi:hypothetical protein
MPLAPFSFIIVVHIQKENEGSSSFFLSKQKKKKKNEANEKRDAQRRGERERERSVFFVSPLNKKDRTCLFFQLPPIYFFPKGRALRQIEKKKRFVPRTGTKRHIQTKSPIAFARSKN